MSPQLDGIASTISGGSNGGANAGGQSAAYVLAALPVDPRSRRAALAVGLVSLALFLAIAPFAKQPLPQFPLFITIIQTALILNGVLTATLLVGQWRITSARPLLLLACGYVYSAAMALVHMLTFPGVFLKEGLLHSGPQSTAYLYIFWHTGFPVAVIAYALLKTRPAPASARPAAVGSWLICALGIALLLAALAVGGGDMLPPILSGIHYSSAFNFARMGMWGVTAVAVALLWRRRLAGLLDIWLLVAMCAWFFEIGLAAVINAGRYDAGFYAGRVFGLLSSTFVLVVLFREQSLVYAALLKAHETERSAAALRDSQEVLSLAMKGGRMGAWSRNLVTDAVWWSPELEEIFGLSPGAFGQTHHAFQKLIHEEDWPLLRAAVDRSLADHQDYDVEFRFRHASGEWRWMDGRGRPGYDAQGRPSMLFGIGIDITARKQAAREIETRFQALVDGMPQLAWMARPDGWIYWYNQRWYEYTGATPADMEGWGWQSVHDAQVLPSVMERWQRSIATGRQFEMVFPLRGNDGRFRPFLTRVSPVRNAAGEVVHWFGTNTDIAAQSEAQEALRLADRRKDVFLATLAHELRNPLAPISSALAVLKRVQPLPERAEWARQIMDRQTAHLSHLVDDLLDVSRITQGKIQLRTERIALLSALGDAVDGVKAAAEAAQLDITVVAASDLIEVEVDPTRATQILLNLLNNAVKFTPRGGRIVVTVDKVEAMAQVSIRDSGIGIAPEHLQGIFDMFSQVDAPIDRTRGGLGIGLALVRGLVDLHGGTVQARSGGLGQGSEFIVGFPLAQAAPLQAPEAALPGSVCGQTRRRVLIVDDNRDAAATLYELLQLDGHEVRQAHDGFEGVQAVAVFQPETVLLDIGMPGMNGYQAAQEIRALPNGASVFLIALTGWGQESDKERARLAGFDLHLTKPVDPVALQKALSRQ